MSELVSVVLTGFGAITARGDFSSASTLKPLESTGNQSVPSQIENFRLEDYLSSQKTYLDRASALSLAGCALALRDAGIEWPPEDAESFGITLGTHLGCIETMRTFWDKIIEKGARLANPLLFSHSYFNSPISLCAIEFGLKGYHSTFCANEQSGLEAVRAAHDAIALGHADAMLCGGAEANSAARQHFEPQENAAEAAAFFILESAPRAQKRGAKVLAELNINSFENMDLKAARQTFGACGGATGALAVMQKILN